MKRPHPAVRSAHERPDLRGTACATGIRIRGRADLGATWGLVAVLLTTVSAALWGYPIVATTLVVAAAHDGAAALFLLGWSGVRGGLRAIARLVASREAGAVIACSLLGGPVFMGGYVASMILAGPAYALTLTATYPVIGAVLADRMLRQRLTGVGWLAVVGTTLGAALTAFGASSTESGVRTLVGLAIALMGAAAVALEGILAYKIMVTADPDAVLVLRQVFSAVLLAIAVLAVPDGHHHHVGSEDVRCRSAHPHRGCDRRLFLCDLVPRDPQDRRRQSDDPEHHLRDVGNPPRLDDPAGECEPIRRGRVHRRRGGSSPDDPLRSATAERPPPVGSAGVRTGDVCRRPSTCAAAPVGARATDAPVRPGGRWRFLDGMARIQG